MVLMAVSRFERFFRSAAGVDVDKDNLRRYSSGSARYVSSTCCSEAVGTASAISSERPVPDVR
ncbi:hypothetical protein GCM10023194_25450 [Planotetraspora phitsanulokensis]|uniref:Uncharacterized protein n=1 Tax=Planotetraspora phitsanulokensis TaxID=575192 RepID=A0A8J3UDY9_9ACTN|nr:hypothetical protein [Planotetraspora phitsanulokensis]GII41892.1 hypothetical protein Pph01_68950 [Planotetraspora phitsanulokensis]